MNPLWVAACCVFVCSFHFSNCFPSAEDKGYSHSSSSTSSTNGFQISTSETTSNGECISKVLVRGHGIHKIIDYPCSDKPKSIISLNKTLLLGEEYFSDTHGELIRLQGKSCSKEIFTGEDGSSSIHALEDAECEKIKIKIEILKEEHHSWLEWLKEKQKEAYEQFLQLQNNLSALQQNLFGGFFGGLFG